MTGPTVVFPKVASPLVSVVVVTYGGLEWVIGALKAILDNTRPCYEVIVVDNASPDGTGPGLVEAVAGATVVLNDVNVGFGAAANQAALLAVGQHVFFLNSDAFVQPGWLPPLLAVLDTDPGVAAVAPGLTDPDGTLQEAGGLVGANGYAGQHGMGEDSTLPQFRFRRQVDFASAAALLVRRQAFLAVGGFHPSYVMGYFEDVDLCLELARRGLRTVYESASMVTHLRGASTPGDDALRRATASHEVFLTRWSDECHWRAPVAELNVYPHRLVAVRDHLAVDRILVVSNWPVSTTRLAATGPLVQLLSRWADLWPTARITLAAGGATGLDPSLEALLEQGIEVAVGETDWDRWMADRRFHYPIVAVDGIRALERFGAGLDHTQPQAAHLYLARFADGPVDVEMAAVRSAAAVICLSEQAYELVQAWGMGNGCDGSSGREVVGPTYETAKLVDVMARLGIGPPAMSIVRGRA